MRMIILFIALTLSTSLQAQLSSTHHKSLNSYIDYANQSAEETTALVDAIRIYYSTLQQQSSWSTPRFVCPVQPDDYYFNKAVQESKANGNASLINALKALRSSAEKLDLKCKELDTYHKLEDYKQDNYARAFSLIDDLHDLLTAYNKTYSFLRKELETDYAKKAVTSAYTKADKMMREQLDRERAFLDLWKFNLQEKSPSGWITDKLQQDILMTDAAIKELRNYKPTLKYPASSQWPSFIDALNSILEIKRNALDGYNHEARKSDKHSNDVYLSLINYFNGALMASYNSFIGYAHEDNYLGLKYARYFPLFEIRKEEYQTKHVIKPFQDVAPTPLSVGSQKVTIPKPVFKSLGHYVDFINETYRTISHQRDLMRNFNSSASYYKGLTSYAGKGGLSYTHRDFIIPYSFFQKCIAESNSLPPAQAKLLNQQAEVIVEILKEMDQLGIALENEVQQKQYEQDNLKQVYERLERYHFLFNTWDEKKEMLYNDLRSINDSYQIADANNSWYVSGRALRTLADLDREGLFKAKAHYKGSNTDGITTDQIDMTVRNIVANEFTNLKGIPKLGRYNGLCPYTPYEDIPVRSKNLSEQLKALKPAKENDNNTTHPYYSMVYQYNDVVEYYNKFALLSPVPLLKTIKQPVLFFVVYPESKSLIKHETVPSQQPIADKKETKRDIETKPVTKDKPPLVQHQQNIPATSKIKVVRDTVYIEKRDTIYMMDPSENLRSMEGYATNNMVLLLDVSGSMNAPEKLPLLKKSVLDLISMMRKEDELAIVVFSGKPKVLLSPSSFKDDDRIKRAINALKPGGNTDGNAGLKIAYKVANENYIRGGNNRIVLATDGQFVISDETTQLIAKFSKEDIYLTVFNFGKGMGASKSLEKLSVLGKGNYEDVSKDNVDFKLIREVKAKRK